MFAVFRYWAIIHRWIEGRETVEKFHFTPLQMPAGIPALRQQVRTFLERELTGMSAAERAHSWSGFNAEFSKKLGAQNWIGMIWPKQYGGHECSALERYVVIEELLVAGAPVAAHWIADRQSGALLLRFGKEVIRQRYLPLMAKGELYFCIGMSEPNSGSDLASIKTRATKVDGGWLINGSKLWTTNADKAHIMIALVRTSHDEKNRHAGISQFLIDLSSPGVDVNAITDHAGETHFGEVFLTDVFVADEMLLGNEGDGWKQVNAELSLERSGPERYLSSYRLFEELLQATADKPSDAVAEMIGTITAELWTLRQMSMSVAGLLNSGENPALEAAIVKDLGACFEQNLPPLVQAALGDDIDSHRAGPLDQVLSHLLKATPSFSLRGGTREILRGIIAKGLTPR
jgi:alkylation response protein AidB-like acyl-CoA dehydrogenase